MRHQPRSWQSHVKECRRRFAGRKKIHLAQPLVVRDSMLGCFTSGVRSTYTTHAPSKNVSTAERLGASMLISTPCSTLSRVNATSTRTAEVTISIALDSYRTSSRHCIIQLVCALLTELSVSKKNVKKGSASNEIVTRQKTVRHVILQPISGREQKYSGNQKQTQTLHVDNF